MCFVAHVIISASNNGTIKLSYIADFNVLPGRMEIIVSRYPLTWSPPPALLARGSYEFH